MKSSAGPVPTCLGYYDQALKKGVFGKRTRGGVKMACSSVALALVLWIVVQFSSQSGMTAVLEAASAVRMPVNTIQSYLNNYADWHSSDRVRRGAKRLPQLENKELHSTISFVENQLTMMGRHEKNIMSSDVRVKLGSVLHGAYIESLPTSDALVHGKDAFVALKASQHIGSKYCNRLGIDDRNCALLVSKFSLNPTSLGTKCANHYRQAVFCSDVAKYRTNDGSCNHPHHPAWGQALTAYSRFLPSHYDDGFQKPRGSTLTRELPSARLISTTLSQGLDSPDTSITLAALQWGQFVAEDMTHTAVSKMWTTGGSIACCDVENRKLSPRHVHPLCFSIEIPSDDPVYSASRQSCMSYVRSLPAMRSDCTFGPLEQLNQATHLLDGSMVYGNSVEKANSLRSRVFGRLRTVLKHGREFLPTIDNLNVNCHVGKNSTCYQTGDTRVNVQPHLAVMHTLWVREHNRVAERLAALNPHWSDERLYQEARRIVVAEIQHITYNEWLPAVLGLKFMRGEPLLQPKASGYSNLYKDNVNPGVSNSFASAALRSFNSMLEDQVRLYNEHRSPMIEPMNLQRLHSRETMHKDDKLDALVRGLATQSAQKMDLHHSHRFQHKLFSLSEDASWGLDGLSLDIQRGRDHGLPSYNSFRDKCGIRKARYFDDLADTIPTQTISQLKKLYKSVDDIDLLVGGMAEYASEGVVGPVFKCIIAEQFKRTRTGDRFFYDNGFVPGAFTESQLNEIKQATLARVFCDNTNNVLTMQPYVFNKPLTPSNDLAACSESIRIRRMSLDPWLEEPPHSVLEGI
ncbi:peroxidase-like isoform X2 [Macrosteles quadrilineatus]|uniref:peroxidase-like isoform X2 n=2 Tax=Macrosteles quadrilineatus TaxID=74068 RepID=UPI0023E0C19A|nr:peroxidase-like isoform X2 [Macrosteles quadrilineatus]